jgi:hypothetical protein
MIVCEKLVVTQLLKKVRTSLAFMFCHGVDMSPPLGSVQYLLYSFRIHMPFV